MERSRSGLWERFNRVRKQTEDLTENLFPEDMTAQSAPFTSPTKWHLAHTTWAWEQFVLKRYVENFRVYDQAFHTLFNSYYLSLGTVMKQSDRGHITRPTVRGIIEYRQYIDEEMGKLFETISEKIWPEVAYAVELAIAHEEQHQELILMDLKHLYFQHPRSPIYKVLNERRRDAKPRKTIFHRFDGNEVRLGAQDFDGFSFDNERARHLVMLRPFRLQTTLVSNADYMAFMQAGGYCQSKYWLDDGWRWIHEHGVEAPLYWRKDDRGAWSIFTLHGEEFNADEPVCHVSYYEADAFARWSGARLPREEEWEYAASNTMCAHRLQFDRLHPSVFTGTDTGLVNLFDSVWQWTQSAYLPYPGFIPDPVAEEYNGKFMIGQMVLRGSSALTPPLHSRKTYRNFFRPGDRWQMSGIRLARDV